MRVPLKEVASLCLVLLMLTQINMSPITATTSSLRVGSGAESSYTPFRTQHLRSRRLRRSSLHENYRSGGTTSESSSVEFNNDRASALAQAQSAVPRSPKEHHMQGVDRIVWFLPG